MKSPSTRILDLSYTKFIPAKADWSSASSIYPFDPSTFEPSSPDFIWSIIASAYWSTYASWASVSSSFYFYSAVFSGGFVIVLATYAITDFFLAPLGWEA
jgi:hypothetical protein